MPLDQTKIEKIIDLSQKILDQAVVDKSDIVHLDEEVKTALAEIENTKRFFKRLA